MQMTNSMDLRELYEARDGLPTEDLAARKIATFAVIPAAIVGLLVGSRFVGLADPIERLLCVCIGAASGAGFGVAFLVLGIYYLFGFRPVAVLADAMVGCFMGLLFGGTLCLLLMWLRLVHHDHALWGLVLIPLGAVVVPLFRFYTGKARTRRVATDAVASQTAESHGPIR